MHQGHVSLPDRLVSGRVIAAAAVLEVAQHGDGQEGSALPRSLGDGLRGSSKAKSRNTVSLMSVSIVSAGSSEGSRPKRVSATNRQAGQQLPL